jgi:hypothetical protein
MSTKMFSPEHQPMKVQEFRLFITIHLHQTVINFQVMFHNFQAHTKHHQKQNDLDGRKKIKLFSHLQQEKLSEKQPKIMLHLDS